MAIIIEEKESKRRPSIPEELPVLPSSTHLYPSIVYPLGTSDPKAMKLLDDAAAGDKMLSLFALRPGADGPTAGNIYPVGTAALIVRLLRVPDGSVRAYLQGLSRVRLGEVTQSEPYLRARVTVLEEKVDKTSELEALVRNLRAVFQKVAQMAPNLPSEVGVAIMNITEPGNLADFIAAQINLKTEEAQEVLETLDVADRIARLSVFLNRELEVLELGSKIQSRVKEQLSKSEREFFLREQLKAIQKELGEMDERTVELDRLRKKVDETGMLPEAHQEAHRELGRLAAMPPQSPEAGIIRTYLEWLTILPWVKSTEDSIDLKHAAEVLDRDHYDLDKVKDRVLDYLAVRKLKTDMKGPILCFVGPPGTGKTSMGQSIARAMGRNFTRMSLGGIRDEADIRGHRRTYIGALPGRIIQGLRRAGSNNPVFMLDEVDKIGIDFRGDPASALLEALDPEQNSSFVDHYLDVPFDLSRVMFITTANFMDPVPPALRDRMEVLELPGYTTQEKLVIARNHLMPRVLEANGLNGERLQVPDEALLIIMEKYTREAGVRNLGRELDAVCRKVARLVAAGEDRPVTVTQEMLHQFLGPEQFKPVMAESGSEVGVAVGMAVTPAGGEVLFVEVTLIPGRGSLTLTGRLGDVMQESARAALTYARSRATSWKVDPAFYDMNDLHIHLPAGAIPKDGPSAGITIAVALASALTKRPVRKDISMTGEITLRGKVMAVGGIKEKVLGAHRAGIRKIILPRDNEKDLEEVPKEVREEVRFFFIEGIDEALPLALEEAPPEPAE